MFKEKDCGKFHRFSMLAPSLSENLRERHGRCSCSVILTKESYYLRFRREVKSKQGKRDFTDKACAMIDESLKVAF